MPVTSRGAAAECIEILSSLSGFPPVRIDPAQNGHLKQNPLQSFDFRGNRIRSGSGADARSGSPAEGLRTPTYRDHG